MSKLNLAELHQRLSLLEAQQQWVQRVLETYGIKGLWLSPGKASPLLGVSRDRIIAEIERAERMRATNKRGDLTMGFTIEIFKTLIQVHPPGRSIF